MPVLQMRPSGEQVIERHHNQPYDDRDMESFPNETYPIDFKSFQTHGADCVHNNYHKDVDGVFCRPRHGCSVKRHFGDQAVVGNEKQGDENKSQPIEPFIFFALEHIQMKGCGQTKPRSRK